VLTAHVKRLGERYGELLDEHQRLLREAFAAHGGREIDTQGDSFMVAFARAKQAVAAAVEAQRALAGNEWPDGLAVLVRMGLHSGEPTVGADRYHGLGVHRAARIAAAGHGGQVLLSSATRELVEDDLPPGVGLRDLGAFRLKDIDRPERLPQLVVEGLPDAFPPVRAERAPVEAVGWRRHRTLLTGALAGTIAAAVAVPLFALGGGQGGSRTLKSLAGKVEAAPPTLDGILSLKGVIEVTEEDEREEDRSAAEAAILKGFDQALADLLAMRREEGATLGRLLSARLDEIAALAARAEKAPGRKPEAIKARLAEQVATLLAASQRFDSDRLHQEAIMLASKADIREELDRLASHVAQAQKLIADGGPGGRRLDFLAQELNRESNTLTAKANDVDLTNIGLELKSVVEQFREQVQNLE